MNPLSRLSAASRQKHSPLSGVRQAQDVSRVGSRGASFSSHIVAASRRGDTVTISDEGRALAAAMLNKNDQEATAA